MNEDEFTKMFEKYGEYSEAYVNKDKSFGFIKMDTRMAAEAAKNALDGSVRKGRNLTVRFATLSTAIHVSITSLFTVEPCFYDPQNARYYQKNILDSFERISLLL